LIARFSAALGSVAAEGGHVLAAVSGGSDSMALLELLALVRDESRIRISVGHVDHAQRPDSAADGEIVERRASALGIPFNSQRIADPSKKSEAALRQGRYEALGRMATERGAEFLATGHTADDQIETVLLRLLRGAGRRGMSGIPRSRGAIIRPLLGERRDRLQKFLVARGVSWAEDPSNSESDYSRNRLRNHVVPTIGEQFGPQALTHLPEMAARWSAEETYLESEAARYLAYSERRNADGSSVLDLAAFDLTPAALRGRVLKLWAERGLGGRRILTMRQLESIETLVGSRDGSHSRDLAGSRFVREYEYLRMEERTSLESPQSTYRYDFVPALGNVWSAPDASWQLRVLSAGQTGTPVKVRRSADAGFEHIALNPDRLPNDLVLRPVSAGDRIRCARHGSAKVRDIMVNCRVPLAARASWPVLVSADTRTSGPDEILWVPGLATREAIAAEPGAERTVEVIWNRTTKRRLADAIFP
jgi:tRNA(Ile)-lysidine synthase